MDSELRAAHDAFYQAFARGDAEAMDEVWAQRDSVTCVHPGRDVIHGRTEVMASWRAILGNEGSPVVHGEVIEAFGGETTAAVLCYERIDEHPVRLIATNVFVREEGRWRISHHQASPGPRTAPPQPRTLN